MYYASLLTATTSATVAEILQEAGGCVSSVMGWVQEISATITKTPLLMFTIGFMVLGVAVSFVSRLLRR